MGSNSVSGRTQGTWDPEIPKQRCSGKENPRHSMVGISPSLTCPGSDLPLARSLGDGERGSPSGWWGRHCTAVLTKHEGS